MPKEDSIVGELINFRGLVYSPINEQGVVFLFGRVLDDLNMYIEEVRTQYPDCVARRYTGTGWKKVYIEFEYVSSNFLAHKHNPQECDIIVCWEDDLNPDEKKLLQDVEIIELRSIIEDPNIKNTEIKAPEKDIIKSSYDLNHHFRERGTLKPIQDLYSELDRRIREIDKEIFTKVSKNSVTYYSPVRVFIYVGFRKNGFWMNLFTNQQKIPSVVNIKNHENWGRMIIKSEKHLDEAMNAIRQSYQIMKDAVKNNINTGWFAVTPKDHLEEEGEEETIEEMENK